MRDRVAAFLMIALAVGAAPVLSAQESSTEHADSQASAPRRAGRQEVRQFLGLGTPPDAAAAAKGERLYGPNCAFCHGAKASGAEAPDLIRSPLVLHDEKGEGIGPIIHNGRPDRGMPAFSSFTDAQLYDIAEFLHMRVELSANRGLYKVQNIVTGNANSGQSYFNGAGGCSACHSVTGDLAHIGSKMQPADLQQAFLYPARPAPTKVTITFSSGERVSGKLKRMDDFHVSMYDASGSYHSYVLGPGIRVEVEDTLLSHRQLLDRYTDADMHNLLAYLVTLK